MIQQVILGDGLKSCDCEGISPSSAQESSSALELCQPRIKCLQLAWILPRSFDCGRFLRICLLSIAPESPENDSISFQRVVPVDGTARPNDVCAPCRASQRVAVLGPGIEDLDAREPSDRYLCGKAIGPKRGEVSMHVVGWTVGVVGTFAWKERRVSERASTGMASALSKRLADALLRPRMTRAMGCMDPSYSGPLRNVFVEADDTRLEPFRQLKEEIEEMFPDVTVQRNMRGHDQFATVEPVEPRPEAFEVVTEGGRLLFSYLQEKRLPKKGEVAKVLEKAGAWKHGAEMK